MIASFKFWPYPTTFNTLPPETKYLSLQEEFEGLKLKLDELNQLKDKEEKKETEFSEKIDELNQETDTLLEEIDKWQT